MNERLLGPRFLSTLLATTTLHIIVISFYSLFWIFGEFQILNVSVVLIGWFVRDRVVALIEKKYAGKGKADWKKKPIERKTKRMKKVLLDWNHWC